MGEGGVDISLLVLPRVAATEGDEGGSGDLVKYTTLAREPPTCTLSSCKHRAEGRTFRKASHLRQYGIRVQCNLGGKYPDCLGSIKTMGSP